MLKYKDKIGSNISLQTYLSEVHMEISEAFVNKLGSQGLI